MSDVDFIEVYDDALSAQDCAAIVQRMQHSNQLQPGRVGGGVHPDLKHSRDLRISGSEDWRDVDERGGRLDRFVTPASLGEGPDE